MEAKFAPTLLSIHDQPVQHKYTSGAKHPVQQMLDNVS